MNNCPHEPKVDDAHARHDRPKFNTVGTERKMKRTTRTKYWKRAVSAASAAVLLASACSSTATPTEETSVEPPPSTATTTTTTGPAPDTGTAATEPAPTTTTAATTTTTTEPPPPKPTLELRSAPQIHGNTLAARWLVAPLEANCYHDLLNADSEVIGTGVAGIDLYEDDDGTRFINERYDPATAEAVDSVVIRCSVRGGEETAAHHPVRRPVYQNRHPDSVFPADDEHYFDHDEIRALFSECREFSNRPQFTKRPRNPITNRIFFDNAEADLKNIIAGKPLDRDGDGGVSLDELLAAHYDLWPEVYRDWDTASLRYDSGFEFATGWWTTEQLRMRYPKSTITADNASQLLAYSENVGVLTGTNVGTNQDYSGPAVQHLFPIMYKESFGTYYLLRSLYHRLASDAGYSGESTTAEELAQLIKDTGLSGTKPNPPRVSPHELLWDWMDHRHSYVPVDREPTAWAMRTLLEARDSECVAATMREHCESGEFHLSPHMRHPSQDGSRLGSVLWSLICPEIKP